ncbi:MAG: hypothetical protein AAF368_13255, partial [Planctomycetota bacterium]
MMSDAFSRRDVVRGGVAVGLGGFLTPAFSSNLVRSGDDVIRVGVIGCGGRGTGAAANAIAAHPSVRITAIADLFEDRLTSSAAYLEGRDDAE